MSVLDRLVASPGIYWGEGRGPANSRFVARVAITAVGGDRTGTNLPKAVTFDYETWSPGGGLQHAETARIAIVDGIVTLVATSSGEGDTMTFHEGETGVFGSVGAQRVGLVIAVKGDNLTISWWWSGSDGQLREQSQATVVPMRPIVEAPQIPGAQRPAVSPTAAPSDHGVRDPLTPVATRAAPEALVAVGPVNSWPARQVSAERDLPNVPGPGPGRSADRARAADSPGEPPSGAIASPPAGVGPQVVPWPGILILHGTSTGVVAQRLAARLTRAAVVRTDLFDRAVRGTAGRPDPVLRHRIALSVVQGYAATGHPVILHGTSTRAEHEELVRVIAAAGLSPVQLVEVSEGEDYGEIARRLIDSD